MSETKKILSIADIKAIKEQVNQKTALREDGYHVCVTVHMGTCGIASGSREILNALMDELAKSNRRDVRLTTSGCIGACHSEPELTIETLGGEPILYGNLDPDKARKIFVEHVMNGRVVPQLVVTYGAENR